MFWKGKWDQVCWESIILVGRWYEWTWLSCLLSVNDYLCKKKTLLLLKRRSSNLWGNSDSSCFSSSKMIIEKALWGSVCILQLCFYKLFRGHGHGLGGGTFLDVLVRAMEFRLPNDTSSLSVVGVMSTTQHSGSIIRFHVWRLSRQVLFQRSHNFPLTSQQFFFPCYYYCSFIMANKSEVASSSQAQPLSQCGAFNKKPD